MRPNVSPVGGQSLILSYFRHTFPAYHATWKSFFSVTVDYFPVFYECSSRLQSNYRFTHDKTTVPCYTAVTYD